MCVHWAGEGTLRPTSVEHTAGCGMTTVTERQSSVITAKSVANPPTQVPITIQSWTF